MLRGAAYLLLVVAVIALLPDFWVLPQVVHQPYGALGWYYKYGLWLNALAVGGTAVSLLIFRVCRQSDRWLAMPARILVWGVVLLFVGRCVFHVVLEMRS